MDDAEHIASVFQQVYAAHAPQYGRQAGYWLDKLPAEERILLKATIQGLLDLGIIHPASMCSLGDEDQPLSIKDGSLECQRLGSLAWDAALKSLHRNMDKPNREHRLWADMAFYRSKYLEDLERLAQPL